jgi:hypothetical protein
MKRRNWWLVYSDAVLLLKVCLKTFINYVIGMDNSFAHLQQASEGLNKPN